MSVVQHNNLSANENSSTNVTVHYQIQRRYDDKRFYGNRLNQQHNDDINTTF